MSAEPDRPSARAVERLATGVGDDVADLRTQLNRALDEAGRLQAAGREDLAVSVLQEQRDVLLAVHHRLESRLADAAVEREAERVLHGATPPSDLPDPAPVAAVPSGDDGMTLRLLASAVAAVLGIALLVTPEVGSRGLTAAGSSAASDALLDSASSRAGDAAHGVGGTHPAGARLQAGGDGHVTDLRALALPEADVLAHRTRNEDAGSDDDSAGTAELPVPGIGPAVDALTSLTPLSTDPDDDASAGSEIEDGASAEDDDGSSPAGSEDDTASDESASGTEESSQDTTTDDGSGTDGATSEGDGSTDQDSRDGDSSADGGGGTSGHGLDLGGAGGGPMAGER